MTRKRLEALLFGIIGALIVQISIAATSQYLMPINSPSWLNTALGVKQSISVNVTATNMTQASTPNNNYVANPSNIFDFSGPFLSSGNGLQIGNAISGYYSGILVNEPSNMSNPLLLLGFNNSLMFTVSAGGNVTAAGNINGSSIGSSSTPITGSTGTFSGNISSNGNITATGYVNGSTIGSISTPITGSTGTFSHNVTSLGNINAISIGSAATPIIGGTLSLNAINFTNLTVPYSSSYTHSIQIGTNSVSVANPSAALFISIPSNATNVPFAVDSSSGSQLFAVDLIGNISAAGNINGSSIGSSSTPITGSTLVLNASNATILTVPYPSGSGINGIQIGNPAPGHMSGLNISVPSGNGTYPISVFNSTSWLLALDTNGNATFSGNVSAVDGKFSGNVNAASYGTSGGTSTFNGDIKATSGNISTKNGTFSGVVNLSGGTLNKIAYGRIDGNSGNVIAQDTTGYWSSSSNMTSALVDSGQYKITLTNYSNNLPVCMVTPECYNIVHVTPTSNSSVNVYMTSPSCTFDIICFMN